MNKEQKQLSAEQWFGRADDFWATSRYLEREKPAGIMPVMVCKAFATEAYLKALLTLRGTPVPQTHNLHRLFEMLPAADKCQIEEGWNQNTLPGLLKAQKTAPDFADVPSNLAEALKQAALAFLDWRYLAEGTLYWFVGGFPMQVREVIFEAKPDWRDNPPDEHGKPRPADV